MNVITKVFLYICSLIYLAFLLRRAIKSKIDLFDLLYLITVVAIPCFFSLFDVFFAQLSEFIGIRYPFVLMFSLIHGTTYLYTTIQASEINKLKQRQLKLIQEISLLRDSFEIKNH